MKTPTTDNLVIAATYRDYLKKALSGRGGLNTGQTKAILARYDAAMSNGHAAQSTFAHLLEAYGSEDTTKAVASIESELNRLNETHEGIETDRKSVV